ncbi:MAG: hypothetical protein CM1200mP4_5110 [Rhodospirillaceae bacterium]|nr:MAG: hypothetical protein CM1200mP4_5110 [Rhodospirillaceae bacterium]
MRRGGEGIDFRKPITKDMVKTLNSAFVRYSVLVVRDQKLNPRQMLAAVCHFGSTFEQQNKRFSIPECPEIPYISNQERYPDGTRYIPGAGFHTDHSNDLLLQRRRFVGHSSARPWGGHTVC